MRPGHEDRENVIVTWALATDAVAAMRPGHEDRENARKRGGVDDVSPPQ